MATVTTALPMTLRNDAFASPGASTAGIVAYPLQRMVYTVNLTVAIKDAANESFAVLTATLPARFFYRITDIRIICFAESLAVFTDWESAMAGLITEEQVSGHQFEMVGGEAFKVDQNAVSKDFGRYFLPSRELSPYLIDASKGVSQIVIRWLDNSSDATAATQVIARIEADQFTPVQANAAFLNHSLLTYR